MNTRVHTKKRAYVQRRRADSTDETRSRIVEATMALHEKLGPRHTTISAIAERAGVQRLTVYRHFEDDDALFAACTSTWLDRHPPPDAARWADIADGRDRALAALRALYAYYRSTTRMWRAAHRDEDEVPALAKPMNAFRAYIAGIADDIASHWPSRRRSSAAVRATVRHAVKFPTWASLADEGLDDDACAELALAWLEGAAPTR